MRDDRRPYWVKKAYLRFRRWYTHYYLHPACDYFGPFETCMKPWFISISGPNIRIGKCATIIGEPEYRVKIGVWGREQGQGKIEIGDYVLISPGVRISASDEIIIEDNVMMANSVYITDSDWHGIYDRANRSNEVCPVHIKENAWLGDRCTVLKGVTVGKNSIVAANAVVTRDVPDNVIVAGNPAKVVKELDTEREMKTRADYFADPAGLEQFFDSVDKTVLGKNTTVNWLRSILKPSRKD